jgi:hypothetical protein
MCSKIVFVSFHSSSVRVKRIIDNICKQFTFDHVGEEVQKRCDPLNFDKFSEGLFIPLRIKTRYYVADVSLYIHNALSEVKILQTLTPEAVIVASEIDSLDNVTTLLQNLNQYIVPFLTPDVPCIRSLVVMIENNSHEVKGVDTIEYVRDKLLQWSVNYHFEIIFPFEPEDDGYEGQHLLTSNKSTSLMSSLINFLHCHTWKSMNRLNSSTSNNGRKNKEKDFTNIMDTCCTVDEKVSENNVNKEKFLYNAGDEFDR